MLKTPAVAFRDPALRTVTIEMNHLGQPKPRSGNFATVYKAQRPDGGLLAIRTFNRRSDSRRERYQIVSNYLEQKSLSSLVHFEYDERGIRSTDGKFYPLIAMEWVPGVTLFEWARDRSREGFREALAIAAEVWLQVVRELQANGIVHGDLQHGNVMVSSEGYFKLVDYDCLAVPAIMGQPNLEIGMEPYQHPQRTAETMLFPGLDNFSSLVIYVALRALAAAPHLWITYVDTPGYDKLLFRKDDFANPQGSRLYYELMNSPDEQVRDLTHYLMQLVRYDIHNVPPVDEVLLWCNSLEDLLSARDWDMAVQLVRRMGPGEQVNPQLVPLVEEAHRRVACRQALERAIASGDEGEIARAYVPQLLDDYPAAAQLVEQARRTTHVTQVLEVLKAARQYQNWDVFRKTWIANQALLDGRKSAEPFRKEIQRILAADSVRKLMKDTTSDDHAVVEAWKYLQSLGGHPTAEPLAPHLQWRLQRQQLFVALQDLIEKAPHPPTLEHDRKIVETWKPDFFDGHERFRQLVAEHRAAVTRLKRLRAFLELGDECKLENEQKLAGALTQLPESYHPKLRQRCRLAMRRVKAMQKLQLATKQGGSDRELIEAYEALEAAQATALMSDAERQRVDLARQRQPILEQLSKVSQNWPPSELDNRLLEIWDEKLLAGCGDAAPWQPTYQRAKQRRIVLGHIEQAIESVDVAAINRLVEDPSLRGYPLPMHITQGIDEARARYQQQQIHRRQALINSIMENDRARFHELFDARTLSDLCEQYTHHRLVVSRLVETEILPLARSGLALPVEGKALTRNPEVENEFIARWQWPPARFASECRLIVCQKALAPHSNPGDAAAVYSVAISRSMWEVDGQCHRIASVPDWHGFHVYVWFNLDLGFQAFYSEALPLGMIVPPKKKGRWGIFG
jgi:hypothetical protein